jgi:hypothetical protein
MYKFTWVSLTQIGVDAFHKLDKHFGHFQTYDDQVGKRD